MPAPCLVLAAWLLTQGGGEVCTPRPLDNAQLDRVTAGSAVEVSSAERRGSVAAGPEARAKVSSVAEVRLQGSAQRGSRALNIVNATDSAAASGINLWSGGGAQGGAVDQTNGIALAQPRGAELGEWRTEGPSVQESFQEARTVDAQGRVDPVTLALTETTQGNIADEDLDKGTQIRVGAGFAGGGALDVHIGAGSVSASIVLKATFTLTGRTCFLWWCWSDTTKTSGTITVKGDAEPGELSLSMADGVVCAAVLGTCSASGSTATESHHDRTVVVPATIAGAQGEYITVGGANQNVDVDRSVQLSDNAQQAIRALNVSNAAFSAIANGVNVGRGASAGVALQLQQRNLVVQSR